MKKKFSIVICLLLTPVILAASTYLGEYNTDRYEPNSIYNIHGKYGNPQNPDSINNPYGKYGSLYSNQSANNPYATDAPKLYDQEGNYRGKLSANKYDPDSINNTYGKYGNPHSPDSINNPHRIKKEILSVYGE